MSIVQGWLRCAVVLGALVVGLGCADDGSEENPNFVVDGAGGADAEQDAATDAAPEDASDAAVEEEGDCVQDPQTHAEIINACTAAVRVQKSPDLRGLLEDGSLPPLP